VIRAGALRGPTVWEISEFYTARRDDEFEVEILQEISSKAAETGARRINLRLPADSDLLANARRAGFKRRHGESVYRSTSISSGGATVEEIAERVGLRARRSSDDVGLFRLYSAVTPVEVRMQGGMTIDEWGDGQEARLRPKSEWVIENDGRLNGSLGISPFGSERLVSLMTMNDTSDALPGMIICATAEMNAGDAVVMVPEYDVTIRAALEIAGFEREREFDVLTHELAVRVRKPVGVVTAIN
jgi:hypothetical protein